MFWADSAISKILELILNFFLEEFESKVSYRSVILLGFFIFMLNQSFSLFGLFFLNDFLLATLFVPLISIIFVYIGSSLGTERVYNFSLFSAVISFLLSLFI